MTIKKYSDEALKKSFESVSGIPPSAKTSKRPISGHVVSKSQMEAKRKVAADNEDWNSGPDAIYELDDSDPVGDGLTAQGGIHIILRPEVSGRTSYMRGDAVSSGGRPVLMSSKDKEHVVDAYVNSDGPSKMSNIADSVVNMLQSSLKKDEGTFNKTTKINKKTGEKKHGNAPLDAQILGGFRMSEIEGIHYPFSSIEKISALTDISDVLENIVSVKEIMNNRASQSVAEQMLADIKSGKMSTPSMKSLRDYRTAMAIRKKYVARGIGYVLFAHAKGLNIDNPRTYDKTANQRAKVEDVLKKKIASEILNGVKKYVSEFKKSRES
jgi:hypothetical protein